MKTISDYKREDGWLLVSVYAFGWTLYNPKINETVTVFR